MLPKNIEEALARGATVLTGNQRSARSLREQEDAARRGAGAARWEPAAVLSWDTWTAELWTRLVVDGHGTKLLLNRAQEHSVWRGIVEADEARTGGSMLPVDSLAEMAAEAWSRLCAHRGEGRLRGAGVSVDTKAFVRWAAAFEQRCRGEGLLARGQLEGELTRAVRAGEVELARGGYGLVGFDGWTPAQEALAEAVRAAGAGFETLAVTAGGGERLLAEAESGREELGAAARWMRRQLAAKPEARLALIVPGLEGRRAEIDRMLRRVLAPELEDVGATGRMPFEFSLGWPLARTALGAAALDLLRWAVEPLTVERISGLLLSPVVAGGVELVARAEFDAYELRRARRLRPEMGLTGMVRLMAGSKKRAARLAGTLEALRDVERVAGESFAGAGLRSHADWADAARSLLREARWGGTGESLEFQTQRRWEGLLDELATLDFTGVRVNAREALVAVERLARETLFAPESRDAAVQVLGPLESAGSVFDGVWFLGAGDRGWPARPGSSPLLSWHLQKELGMPGADTAADDRYFRRMTERIGRCGGAVVFSFARETAEGRQRVAGLVGGLVATLGLRKVAALELAPEEEAREPVVLETLDDSASLPPVPDRVIRGGAGLLKLQAACGFRAFAEHRLWARRLEDTETGMGARERGNAVHVALETFWKQVRSQPELQALTDGERHAILAEAVDQALEKTAGEAESDWGAAYLDVQRERLLSLLDAWLLKEMAREVPFVVKQSETDLKDVQVGPLRLTLRVDRVDETEFGDVILDYKTGAANPSAWLSDRPEEPQLPLYAVLAGSAPLAGVAFAQVRAGKDMALHGYQTQEGVLLKQAKLQAATLEEQVEQWRACLTALAEDFHRGDVRVRPKQYPHTCEYCEQRLLCRLDVDLLEADTVDDGEETLADGAAEGERG